MPWRLFSCHDNHITGNTKPDVMGQLNLIRIRTLASPGVMHLKTLIAYLGIALGSLLFAVGRNYFIVSTGLAEGGFTGIALILHYLTGLPPGTGIFVLNIPLFFVSWYMWGKTFVLKTLLGVVMVSLATDLTQGLSLHTEDLLLAALYGGVFSGTGIGLVLRCGASTGGVDILARLIYEKKGISMGKIYFLFDLAVLSLVAASSV